MNSSVLVSDDAGVRTVTLNRPQARNAVDRALAEGLAAAHAVHNGLTAAPGTHGFFHGEKVAYGLLVQLVLEGQPRTVLEQVLRFACEVGLPVTLAEIGLQELPKELLQKVANRATAKGETIHNEPFEVRPDMVADAILAADAMGQAWKAMK